MAAASPTVKDDFTPLQMPLLGLVCTGPPTGTRIVAMLNMRLSLTLSDVRSILVSLAQGGDGGSKVVNEAPLNVDASQSHQLLSAPLHPFNLSGPFSFVHGGGGRRIARDREPSLQLKDVFPRYPRFGAPRNEEYLFDPPAPTCVLSQIRSTTQTAEGSLSAAAAAAHFTMQKRLGVCVLYVAQGDVASNTSNSNIMGISENNNTHNSIARPGRNALIQLDRVLEERLALQRHGSGFGQVFQLRVWAASISRWNANVPDLLGRSLLHDAVADGNEAAVRHLLTLSFVSVNVQDRQGNTPLHLAVRTRQLAIAKMLVADGGANILLPNRQGDTPLHVALQRREAQLLGVFCAALRAAGVDAQSSLRDQYRNYQGFSPMDLFELYSPTIMELCAEASLLAVRSLVNHFLFDRRHLTSRCSGTQRTLLHVASINENADVLAFLVNDVGLFSENTAPSASHFLDHREQTPLHLAVAHGREQNVVFLIKTFPHLLARADINGDTPLLLASKSRQRFRVCQVLLTQCAPSMASSLIPDACDRNGFTALHYICAAGQTAATLAMVTALVEYHGASVRVVATPRSILDANHRNAHLMDPSRKSHTLKSTSRVRNSKRRGTITAAALSPQQQQHRRRSSAALLLPRAHHTLQHGGGMRGYTPLLCAIAAGGAQHKRVTDMLAYLCAHGALEDSVEDARDLLFYLLTSDKEEHYDMADGLFGGLSSSSSNTFPTAVRRLFSDNVMLCRFCASKCAVGIRWCVERHCGDLHSDVGGIPMLCSASTGDVDAVRYLMSAGASPCALVSGAEEQRRPLHAAIVLGHEEVARALIQGGARLCEGGGAAAEEATSWSALRTAVEYRCEAVVRGILGLSTCTAADVSEALLAGLRALSRVPPPRAASVQTRICLALSAHVDLTTPAVTAATHPVELIHLAASQGLFDVAEVLATRCAALAQSLLLDMLQQAPEQPSVAAQLVEPTVVPVSSRWKRLMPNGATGTGGLYKPPKPFRRAVLPRYKQNVLVHRIQRRDVFSYAAAAGKVDLVELLLKSVRLVPWTVPDVRGRMPMDYALETSGSMRLVQLFCAMGMPARQRHGRRLLSSAFMTRAVYSLLHASKQGLVSATDRVSHVLCRLVEDGAQQDEVRRLLQDHCDVHGVADASGAGAWMWDVVHSCVRHGRLDMLRILHEEFQYPLSSRACSDTYPHPLLTAVFMGDMHALSYLLGAGCSPAVASLPTVAMSQRIHCARSLDRFVTPICLAAWIGHYEMVRLLAGNARRLKAEDCADTDERVGDVISALIRGVSGGSSSSSSSSSSDDADRVVATAVQAVAHAGHPFLSPLTLRTAIAKGMRSTVEALLSCYGARIVVSDLMPGDVNSLHLLAGSSDFTSTLRSLLSTEEEDAYGVRSRALTPLAHAVRSMVDPTTATATAAMSPVDWALRQGCAPGALLLMALGLTGDGGKTGKVLMMHSSSRPRRGRHTTGGAILVGKVREVLRHNQAHRNHYSQEEGGALSVLHSAVALGYWDVVEALSKEMQFFPADVPAMAVAATNAAKAMLPRAPSVFGLAALRPEDSVAHNHHYALLELAVRDRRISAKELCQMMLCGLPVTRCIDTLCHHPDNRAILSETAMLHTNDDDAAAAAVPDVFHSMFLAHQLQHHARRLFLGGGSLLVSAATPLSCAVLCGSVEWVQYLAAYHSGKDGMSRHRALITEPESRMISNHHHKKKQRVAASPVKGHHCGLLMAAGGARRSQAVDVLTLCVSMIAEYHYRKDAAKCATQTKVCELLLSIPGALGLENVNTVATAAAAMQRWSLLELILLRASCLRDCPEDGRFLFPILEDEVPPTLRRVLGTSRHVMHAVARSGSKEMIVTVAKHSSRADVEQCCDALGRTSAYHVLHHRSMTVGYETFVSLRVPMTPACSKRLDRTPLMIAAKMGHVAMLAALNKPGRINQCDRGGNTALMLAAEMGHAACVELLLAANADALAVNCAGLTAAMLAARAGHDEVAAPLVKNFSQARVDVRMGGTTSSILHCAAMGGCWRTAEAVAHGTGGSGSSSGGSLPRSVILQEDADGFSALYLAYAFGSARVLRILLSALHHGGNSIVDDDVVVGKESEIEQRIIHCDARLESFGWLRGMLTINEALTREAAKQYAPASLTAPNGHHSSSSPPAPGAAVVGQCVIAAVAPPLRSHASSLFWCAMTGNAVGVRVLADFNMADNVGALHVAAHRGHLDVLKLLISLRMSDASQADAAGRYAFQVAASAGYQGCAAFLLSHTSVASEGLFLSTAKGTTHKNSLFHQMAHVCGGTIFAQLIDQLVKQAGSVSRGGGGQHAFCTRLLEALRQPDEAGLTPFEYAIATGNASAVLRVAQSLQQLDTVVHGGTCTDAISISSALLHYLPNLSPPVRALLFDFFGVDAVRHHVGFEDQKTKHHRDEGKKKKKHAVTTYLRRLSFADVRVLGISQLMRDPYCRQIVASVYTVDHEQSVLQQLMKDSHLPFTLRYDAASFHACTLTQQCQLLQWMGSSLVQTLYEDVPEGDVDAIDVHVIRSRAEAFASLASSHRLTHSLYISSSSGQLILPKVADALPSVRTLSRRAMQAEVDALCRRATRRMRRLPYPSLRQGMVSVDWSLLPIHPNRATMDSSKAAANVDVLDHRVRAGLQQLMDYLTFKMRDTLADVREEELPAAAGQAASVVFRYTDEPITPMPPLLSSADMTITSNSSQCVVLYNTECAQDVAAMMHTTIYQGIASDVALAQVSRIREAFLKKMHAILREPLARESLGGGGQSDPQQSRPPSRISLKVELEGAQLSQVPRHSLRALLFAARSAVEGLILPQPSTRMKAYHSAHIISEALGRRLRTVQVLFSVNREPLVKFSGDSLMLCFTADSAPNRDEISHELIQSLVETEITVCRRLLPDIATTLTQRLNSYLPSTRLVLDLAAIDNPMYDRESVLSALRVLVAHHSSLVLAPLVEGLSVGWDTPLGQAVRAGVRQVTVTLETAPYGTCYLSTEGNMVYYCPLQCVQRNVYARSSWQLLTAQQVSSLVMLQLAARQPSILKLIETRRAFACWTEASLVGGSALVAGSSRGAAAIRVRNIVNAPAAITDLQFQVVGPVSKVSVTDKGKGRYRVRFAAPTRAAWHRVHLHLQGQPLFHSPLRVRVRPDAVCLANTRLLSTFNTVGVAQPFELKLQLCDAHGNRLESPVKGLACKLGARRGGGVELLDWRLQSVDQISLRLRAGSTDTAVTETLTISVLLSATGVPEHTFTATVRVVPREAVSRVRRLSAGLSTNPGKEETRLFFRKCIRDAADKRRRQELTALLGGGADATDALTFPPRCGRKPLKGGVAKPLKKKKKAIVGEKEKK